MTSHRASRASAPSPPPAAVRAFHRDLLQWFAAHKRTLPWRNRRTPYRVWVAEVMLQQTRVEQALPYYRRFMRRLPSLRALAEAPRGEVLKLWEGLGYYGRARRLQDTARLLRAHHAGRFPRTSERLSALPGIGPYTAAAIASLAFNEPVAVLDGNAARVLARVFAVDQPPSSPAGHRVLRALASRLLPAAHAAAFNEAIMELGALCCRPRKPDCPDCPLQAVCRARAAGRPESFPIARPKKPVPHKYVGAGVILNAAGEVLLAQRREDDMLGGLWEFPGGVREKGETYAQCIARELHEELGIRVRVGRHLVTVKHAYSHFRITLAAYEGRILRGKPRPIQCAALAWVAIDRLDDYPLSKADLYIRDTLHGTPRATPRPARASGTGTS